MEFLEMPFSNICRRSRPSKYCPFWQNSPTMAGRKLLQIREHKRRSHIRTINNTYQSRKY
jgi:hypothetical protein